jgi:hypothetical protein
MNEASPPPTVPWSTPRIEEVPLDDHYRDLYQEALVDEPLAPWELDTSDGHEGADVFCALLDVLLGAKHRCGNVGTMTFEQWSLAFTSEEKNQFTPDQIRAFAEDGDWTFRQRQGAESYFVDPSEEVPDDLAANANPFFNDSLREEIDREDREARDRGQLLLAAWLKRDIPLRDYLLGGVMCTTSRWFVFGETGVGKTLLGMDMGGAIAAMATFPKWPGQRKARVMYIDGELPMETFKERMELLAKRYGSDLAFYGYNREDLGDDGLPPLNTEAGQVWLKREIEAVKPDIIFFDSIMCLLIGSVLDEAAWMPMRPFVRWLTANHIAQVWLHHANDSGKSFGDKTREWEMDTVVKLSRPLGEDGEPDDSSIRLEFTKARLRTPANTEQFLPLIISPGDDWQVETAPKKTASGGNSGSGVAILRTQFLNAYDRLADGGEKTPGLDGTPVIKVAAAAITAELKSRGFLETDDKGGVTAAARRMLSTAKASLLNSNGNLKLVEVEGLIWRP